MSGKKILFIVLGVVVLAAIVAGMVIAGKSNVTAVTTGKAVRQDLVATVSGTGQIKPKTYVNVGATAFGRITHLYVKEGDHVKQGDILARVESVQPEATGQRPAGRHLVLQDRYRCLHRRREDRIANVAQAKADLEQKTLDYGRAKELYNDKLIAKQDYDAKVAAYDSSVATLAQRQAAVAQASCPDRLRPRPHESSRRQPARQLRLSRQDHLPALRTTLLSPTSLSARARLSSSASKTPAAPRS